MTHAARRILVATSIITAAACTDLPEGPLDVVQLNVVDDECALFQGSGTSASPAGWSYAPELLDPATDESLTGIDPSGEIQIGLDPEQGDYLYTGMRRSPHGCLRVDGADGAWTDADFGVDEGTVGDTPWSQFAVRDGSTLLLALDYTYDGNSERCDAPPAWGPVQMPDSSCTTTVLLTLEW